MRVQNRNQTRPILVFSAIVGIVLFTLLGASYYFKKWPFSPVPTSTSQTNSTINYTKPTEQQMTAGTQAKEQAADSKTAQQDSDKSSSSLGVTITTVQPGTVVYIRAMIDKVTTSATCHLAMVGPGQKTYSAEAPTQALAGTSTCRGFNIPMTSLAPGVWKITVSVTDGTLSGSATTEKEL
jgi:cytoskeletal protein RodZ